MTAPIFSVVIPLYNKQDFISKCIESVLTQSFPSFEIIVIDDGSLDNSEKIVKEIKDDRVRYFHQKNSGVSAARNKGIEEASGEYIAFLDADDWYEDDFLTVVYKSIQEHPDADAFTTGYFKHKNGAVTVSTLSENKKNYQSIVINDFYQSWTKGAFFFTSSCVVRKEYFIKNKIFFPPSESMGEDQEVWFHLAEHGCIVFTDAALSNYNMGVSNSLSFNSCLLDELPFITRLKARVNSPGFGASIASANRLIRKYNLERAANNAIRGSKRTAVSLLSKNILSMEFSKLKIISIVGILAPRKAILYVRKHLKRKVG
ncbi:glycosyltransferase family 2 protein [Aeromonas taiwanensis]|uniref:glycosyltransferase family 2 protein n=1 Tax=Aeromonas taiwanensis TaxID=633417 RepID=UPI0009DD6E36|nr:glycosyltransferase family A protein [Aeromonas taiwanensis]